MRYKLLFILALLIIAPLARGQTVCIVTAPGVTGAPCVYTSPSAVGPSASGVLVTFVAANPGTCTPGTTGPVELNVAPYTISYCSATNTWTAVGTGSGTGVAYTSNAANGMWNMVWETSYGTGYSSPTAIDWTSITHMVFQGVSPSSLGVLTKSTGFDTQAALMISAAHAAGVKVLLDLNDDSSPGSLATAITSHLATLVSNVQAIVTADGFDGINIDFESGYTITLLNNFGSSMRTSCGVSPTCLLVANVQNENGDFNAGNNSSWDKLGAMTYDMGGTGDSYAWFNSALYGPKPPGWQGVSDALVIPRMIANGVPASKLLMGIPFFGTLVTGNSSTSPRGPVGGSYVEQSYGSQIVTTYASCIPLAVWDAQARVNWAPCGGGWLNWETPQSITDKVNYAIQTGLGGIFTFDFQHEYVSTGTTPAQKHPLQNAVKMAFLGYAQGPVFNQTGFPNSLGLPTVAGQRVSLAADFTTANNTNFQFISPDGTTTSPANAGTGLVFNAAGYGKYINSFSCDLAYSQGTGNAAVSFGIQAVEINPTNIFGTGTMQITAGPPSTYVSGTLATLSSTTATAIVTGTPGATGVLYTVHLGGTIENPANSSGALSQNQFAIMVSTATGTDPVTVKRGSGCIVGQ